MQGTQKFSLFLNSSCFINILLAGILSFTLVACSSDSAGLPEPPPKDKVGPVVKTIDPVLNEIDVSAERTSITVEFDEVLDEQSFFPSNVIIRAIDPVSGIVIPGTNIATSYSFRNSTKKLTIRFVNGSLLDQNEYEVVLQEFEDINGNVMDAYKSIFSTTTPPTATISPTDGKSPVSLAAGIVINFSEIVNEASLIKGFELLEISPTLATTKSYKFSASNSLLQLDYKIVGGQSIATIRLFDPIKNTPKLFKKTTKYTVNLSELVTDINNNQLIPMSSSFSTGVSSQVGAVPAKPGIVTAISVQSGTNFSNTVTWPALIEASKTIAYNLYVSVNNGNYTQVAANISPLLQTTYQHEQVSVGVPYKYAVSAVYVTKINPNEYGPESELSDPSNEVIPSVAPPSKLTAIAGPQVLKLVDGAVELSWPSIDQSKYNLYVKVGDAVFTKLNTSPIVASATQPTIYPVIKDSYKPGNDVVYQYAVTIINSNGNESARVFSESVIPFGAPPSITAIAGSQKVTVSWPIWKQVPGLSYSLFAKQGLLDTTPFTQVASGIVPNLASNSVSFTHGSGIVGSNNAPLLNGESYTYKVMAVSTVSGLPIRNSVQSKASITVITATIATLPLTPTGVSVIAENAAVLLTWDIATGKNYDYRIYQKQTASGNYTLLKTLINPIKGNLRIAALNNIEYTFQIAAVVGTIESIRVTTAVVTPRLTGAKISAWQHSCAIKAGVLWCWGVNNWGQLGNGTTSSSEKPVQVSSVSTGSQWVAVATGYLHTCAIRDTGEMYCWGVGNSGELGNSLIETDSTKTRSSPILVDTPAGILVDLTDPANSKVNWTQVVAGSAFTCGIHSNSLAQGQLFCWGNNNLGSLGSTDQTTALGVEFVPQAVFLGADLENNWVGVTASPVHTCGIRQKLNETTLWCWGYGTSGQLGNGLYQSSLIPSQVMSTQGSTIPDNDWIDVAAGREHSCGIRADSTLWCWGINSNGTLGNPSQPSSQLAPIQEGSFATDWVKVFANYYQTCALKTSGKFSCWGKNNFGQAGNGKLSKFGEQLPTPSATNEGWSELALGIEHVCAISNANSIAPNAIACWGNAERNYLGSVASETTIPLQVGLAQDWLDVSAGIGYLKEFTLGLRGSLLDNNMYGWGSNYYGYLGNGDLRLVQEQFPVLETNNVITTWKKLSAGGQNACGIQVDDTLHCWGLWWNLPLSTGTTASPLQVGTGQWLDVDSGYSHACGIKFDNSLWCWGESSYGALGADIEKDSTGAAVLDSSGNVIPVVPDTNNGVYLIQVVNPSITTTWLSVSAGNRFTCAIDSLQDLYCWGYNRNGKLGVGSITTFTTDNNKYVPTKVTTPTGVLWTKVTTANSSACGLTNNGTQNLYCWGSNGYGQLGVSDLVYFQEPLPVNVTRLSTASNAYPWDDVSSSSYHTCARKADAVSTGQGSLWCWGSNDYGELGTGGFQAQYLPSPVLAGIQWKNFTTGYNMSCGIKALGNTLWCWGRNYVGQLGTDSSWSKTPLLLGLP